MALNLLGDPEPGANRLLDFGCGWGYLSRRAVDKGWSVVGIDLSTNELDIARLYSSHKQYKSNPLFLEKDINDFPNKSFDTVLSMQVIEHVHNPGLYLSRINRVLTINGKLLIGIPNIMTFNHIFYHIYKTFNHGLFKVNDDTLKNYDKTHYHIQAWDAYHFVRLVSTLGFKLESCKFVEGWPMPEKLSFLDRPFFQKIFSNLLRLQPFQYTILFKFSKIYDKTIMGKD